MLCSQKVAASLKGLEIEAPFVGKGPEQRTVLWAACDRTGHGVPGAFTSMMANSLLDDSCLENDHRDPRTHIGPCSPRDGGPALTFQQYGNGVFPVLSWRIDS